MGRCRRVKKDFLGPVEIDGVKTQCSLYQAGGNLSLQGGGIEEKNPKKILNFLVFSKLDINPTDWIVTQQEKGRVVFLKK